MLNHNEIVPLLWKYIQKNLTEMEQKHLDLWRNESEENAQLLAEIDDKKDLFNQIKEYSRLEEIFDKSMGQRLDALLSKNNSIPKGGRTIELRKWMMAASVLAVMAVSAYYFLNNKHKETIEATQVVAKDEILPGQQKARLQLADGTVIILEQAKSGELAKQGSAVIHNDNGQLVYSAITETTEKELIYNALITERGETYVTTLSDGSKVWLNAQSSLRFPVSFSKKERRVELKGEAYFEVVGDPSKPFRVVVDDKTIEVLGTRFSVNAYTDERFVKTSLLEGKINVLSKTKSQVLVPGQQLRICENENFSLINGAKVDAEISWTRGIFYFNNQDLPSVLRQLRRWYRVDVIYHGDIGPETFTGYISREIPLSEVLRNIEGMAPVKLEIEDRKVHVYPK